MMAPQAQAEDPFQACRSQEMDYNDYFCFFEVARNQRLWQEAQEEMEGMLGRSGSVRLILGHLWYYRTDQPLADLRERRLIAEQYYQEGAAELEEEGDLYGQVLAFYNLYEITFRHEDRQFVAKRAVEQALEAVEGAEDGLAKTRAWILKARSLYDFGEDLGSAYHLLKRSRNTVFTFDDYRLRRELLNIMGNVALGLGRFQEAQQSYRELERFLLRDGSQNNNYALAAARLNLMAAYLAELGRLPSGERRDEILQLARRALESAEAGQHRGVQTRARITIADLLSSDPERLSEARRYYLEAIQLASQYNEQAVLYVARWALAWNHLKDGNLAEAARLIRQARQMRVENDRYLIYAGLFRLHCAWALEGKAQAVQRSKAVLENIESLRGRQTGSSSREVFFSAWTSAYYLFSGYLLGDGREEPSRQDLEAAFQVTEQMRARVLLENLITGREVPVHSPELTRLRREIAQVNRRLATVRQAGERQPLLAELRRLEELEAQEHNRAFSEQAELLQTNTQEFASLGQVEKSLAEDEALLSFQVGLDKDMIGDFGGGSWLLAASRDGTRRYRLPDRLKLEQQMPVFLGLIQRRDGLETSSAPVLYNDLLRKAVDELPQRVRRLVIVPDSALHHLPFGLLGPSAQGPVLAQRFQISVVPSATLWLRLKDKQPQAAPAPALAFADPDLPAVAESDPSDTAQRDWTSRPLLPLPSAREEGSRLVGRLGGESRLVVGTDASERFVKSADLRRYSLLHFASHAVVDDEFPQRSAVMLAPGDQWEDGRLQVGEIAELDLEGRVIVLSACSSASGTVLSGEGVIGLARAFFRAGARTVVGSLWPLRDDDAAEFFEAFYNHLGEGSSIAGALNAAQGDRIEAGDPAAAWAGLVVLGDGSYIPFPGGLPQASPLGSSLLTLVAALATAAAAGGYLVLRRRRRG